MDHTLCVVDNLNRISITDAHRIVGNEGIAHLDKILKHLFSTLPELVGFEGVPAASSESFDYRYAPSVVARNEAELFGISSPRFAIRGSQPWGLFNLRRVKNLISAVPKEWCTRRPAAIPLPDISQISQPTKKPAQSFKKSQCIADALIGANIEHLEKEGFRVLKTDLGIPYGEGTSLVGVPYVEHISLGGGLCAQAACLMCTLLLHHLSLGVHGAAEITALTVDDHAEEFELSGMTPRQIIDYFNSERVRLASSIETADSLFAAQRERFTQEGLYAYIRSGLPAIVPADAGRIAGMVPEKSSIDSILRTNRIQSLQKPDGPLAPRSHAIVVVGAKREKNPSADDLRFLINDPSNCPLLLATGHQLRHARSYRTSIPENELKEEHLAPFQFISVRPASVRFPLLSVEKKLENGKWTRLDGLFTGAFRLLTTIATEKLAIPCISIANAREWLPGIVRLALVSEKDLPKRLATYSIDLQQDLPADCRWAIQKWAVDKRICLQWIWAQLVTLGPAGSTSAPKILLLWNAEIPEQNTSSIVQDPHKFVLAAFLQTDGSPNWNNCWNSPYIPDTLPDEDDPLVQEDGDGLIDESHGLLAQPISHARSRLQPAIISSFAVPNHLAQLANNWPSQSNKVPFACELYAFMRPTEHRDVMGKGMKSGQWPSATAEMAHKLKVPGAVEEHGNQIQSRLHIDGVNIPVITLASFIPEITCHESDDRWKMATDAITFMLKLGRYLVETDPTVPRIIVEVVAGSRIDGLWPGKDNTQTDYQKKPEIYCANRMSEADGINRLLKCLQNALRAAIPSPDDSRVVIALELEPGPLYLLNSLPAMKQVQEQIDASDDRHLKQLVGFNLDIAHWKMAGIKIEQLQEPGSRAVLDRILHAHLSGHHGRAHLGDAPLGQPFGFGVRKSTLDWIQLLHEIASRRGDGPMYVSLEYEAAKNARLLQKSAETLEWVLRLDSK